MHDDNHEITWWDYAKVGGHLLFGDSGTRFQYRTAESLKAATKSYPMRKRQRSYDNHSQIPMRRFHKRLRLQGRRNHRMRFGGYGSETKFVDSEVTATNVTSAWTTINPTTKDCLNAVVQGTSESEHLGRTLYITSIHLRGSFLLPTLESTVAPFNEVIYRFCLVLDTDTKGVELVATDVMDVGQTADVFAFRNLQHTSRIRVLKDTTKVMKVMQVNEGAVNLFAHGGIRQQFKWHYKFKQPMRVLFNGTTAVVGSIVDNSLHFIVISADTNLQVEYQCRMRFKDNI